jgi:hypothetical protein
VNRIVVAGAQGFFGSKVVELLRAEGCSPLRASRRAGVDLKLDVEDRTSIRQAIRKSDVIVDATAPFQTRSARLVDEAIAIGADVIDLSDSLAYSRLVFERDAAARSRDVRILNACSSVSVLSAFAIERSGIRNPIAIHGFLAPATRHTANPGAALSLLSTVGRPIVVLRDGAMRTVKGWSETREFHALGRRGHLMEIADSFTLPRIYPSLRNVDFWVNPNVLGAGSLLPITARVPALARLGLGFARMLGSNEGTLACEIEGPSGEPATVVFTGPESYLMAAIPAALAAQRLASGETCRAGVVPVGQHVDSGELEAALARHGLQFRVFSSQM